MIVIKKGGAWGLILFAGLEFFLPAYPVRKLVDPTGAGIPFAGGFMGYFGQGRGNQ